MTTTAATCPSWCAREIPNCGAEDQPDDRGTWHESVDLAVVSTIEQIPARVYVDGFRHQNGHDWPDSVVLSVGDREFVHSFNVAEAREVARAMVVAAALIESANGGEDR